MSIGVTVAEERIVEAIRAHQNRNRALRHRFKRRKVSFDDPRPIDFHFWAWTQRDAAVVGRSLYQMGFLVRLLAPAPAENDPDRWIIEAGARIPLIQATGDELIEKMV